jgi:hypothetical protein
VIERGTKIDNLVHVGHNVRIGEHCIRPVACWSVAARGWADSSSSAGSAGSAITW